MIQYKSARGDIKLYSFLDVILKGIANDGGLFVPEKIPKFTLEQLKLLSKKSYQERAIFIFNLFEPDLSENIIRKIVNKAYSTNFDTSLIAPSIHLKDNQYVLELWHGPTSAFKDMALQIMPLLFSEAVKKQNKKLSDKDEKPIHYLILVATSGDTGKAALEGFKNKKGVSIIVFYPDGHVSQLQELQMITQEGSNVAVYAVYGDFDAIQTLVKNIFNNNEFNKKLLGQYQIVLSSANSINWGRLIPQITYHVGAYIDLVDMQAITLGEQINIAIPTGNFGNILAAYYAKKMGLPIQKLICASNENNILTEFLQTGIYNIKKRKLVQTPSPSMDILIASNIERLLYVISHDPKKVSVWINQLKAGGKFEVDNVTKKALKKEFYADWVSNEDCLLNIKKLYNDTKYLVDPHTSVAQTVVERYQKQKFTSSPVIICSTAHWAKFPKDIYGVFAKSINDNTLNEFEILKRLKKITKASIPKNILELKRKTIKHREKCNLNTKMIEYKIINWLKNI